MNTTMNQLIPIFADIIKANNYVTFSYSLLDDRWFFLNAKRGDEYDSVTTLDSPQEAFELMIAECQYYWLEKNNLLQDDLSTEEAINTLSPDIHALLDNFLQPFIRTAENILQKRS